MDSGRVWGNSKSGWTDPREPVSKKRSPVPSLARTTLEPLKPTELLQCLVKLIDWLDTSILGCCDTPADPPVVERIRLIEGRRRTWESSRRLHRTHIAIFNMEADLSPSLVPPLLLQKQWKDLRDKYTGDKEE